ncbi:MAG: GNAT family N-acetyltransferase [Tenuifilaceae bacterium]|nr:GNAT family N-acetyltransferase [Tenuifilaceae bacterium]
MKIDFLKRDDIDTTKWDSCIARSVNGMVYGYSWFLDIVSEDWCGLVGDDYQAVFPLPCNTKYGINYIYQPFFTQQLGLFSTTAISQDLISRFLNAIPDRYKFIAINLNTYNKTHYPKAKVVPRVTHHLDLIEPYSILSNRYGTNTKRNVSRAVAYNISVARSITAIELVELKRKHNAAKLHPKHFSMVKQLVTQAVGNGVGEMLGAYNSHNELCAGALFLKSNGKVIYLLASSTPEGKAQRAMFALIDHYIHQNAEQNLVLDFEGSNIESIARFYKGFGATPCEYSHITINRLPWMLKLFK